MSLKINLEDLERIINLLGRIATGYDEPQRFYQDLIRSTNLPGNWKVELLHEQQWNASSLIHWAKDRGRNPNDEKYHTLGSILNVFLERTGDYEEVAAFVIFYRLCDVDSLSTNLLPKDLRDQNKIHRIIRKTYSYLKRNLANQDHFIKFIESIENQSMVLRLEERETYNKLFIDLFTKNIVNIIKEDYNTFLEDAHDLAKTYNERTWKSNVIDSAQRIVNSSIDIIPGSFEIFKTKIVIYFVIISMNQDEANQLARAEACSYNSNGLAQDFNLILEKCFYSQPIETYTNSYGDRSLDWKPYTYIDDTSTIENLINKKIREINKQYNKNLESVFFDIHTINNAENRSDLKKCRENQCIVIADTISLRHPNIQKYLQLSSIDVYANTAWFTIAQDNLLETMESMSVIIELGLSEIEASIRRNDLIKDKDEDKDSEDSSYLYTLILQDSSINSFNEKLDSEIIRIYKDNTKLSKRSTSNEDRSDQTYWWLFTD